MRSAARLRHSASQTINDQPHEVGLLLLTYIIVKKFNQHIILFILRAMGGAARHSSHDHEGRRPSPAGCLSLQGHAVNRRSRIFTYYRRKFNQHIILFIFKHLLTYFLLLLILNFASCFRYVCAMEGEQPSCPYRSLNSPIFSEHHYLLCFYCPRPPPPKGKILSSGILPEATSKLHCHPIGQQTVTAVQPLFLSCAAAGVDKTRHLRLDVLHLNLTLKDVKENI